MKRIMVIGLIFILLLSSCSVSNNDKIIGAAKKEVLEYLESPLSAQFPDNSEVIIKQYPNEENKYVISFYVDSSNKYGVMIRQDVVMDIEISEDEFIISNVFVLNR